MPITSILNALMGIIWSVLTSRVGQLTAAFAVAWMWSGWRTDDYWKSVIASEKAEIAAKYAAEKSRQEIAASEIAHAATIRAADDSAIIEELRKQIKEFDDQETRLAPVQGTKILPRAPASGCVIDGGFADVLRKFDASARKAKAPRRAK